MPRPGGEAMIVRSEIVGAGCARRRVVSTDARSEDHVVKSTTRYTRPFSGLNSGLAILMVAAVLQPALAGSEDWFSWNIPVWELQLASFVDRPETHYLEIGVFEGRSMLWALDHVLTHPKRKVTRRYRITYEGELASDAVDRVASASEQRFMIARGEEETAMLVVPEQFQLFGGQLFRCLQPLFIAAGSVQCDQPIR